MTPAPALDRPAARARRVARNATRLIPRSHMLVSRIKPCMCNLFDGTYYSDNRSNSRANTCNKPRLTEGTHLLDKSRRGLARRSDDS
ncbi:hypothetical protein K1719_047536 [Acacia pycnantha]|nr:hypothetical protein K1719_047536 [Acacia pycnantha]